jgi:hypothetical protein
VGRGGGGVVGGRGGWGGVSGEGWGRGGGVVVGDVDDLGLFEVVGRPV